MRRIRKAVNSQLIMTVIKTLVSCNFQENQDFCKPFFEKEFHHLTTLKSHGLAMIQCSPGTDYRCDLLFPWMVPDGVSVVAHSKSFVFISHRITEMKKKCKNFTFLERTVYFCASDDLKQILKIFRA